jgi:hypothetical protein
MSYVPDNERPIVPDHELIRRVGRGSYGEVWIARNVMGTFRAVKIVYRSSFDSDRPYEREFGGLQKFEPLSRTHPGFVSILHMGRNTEDGYFYCVMEIADDAANGPCIEPDAYRPRTLAADLGKEGRLPLAECLDLGKALASGLAHLHSRGLVHRDIKPSNIIFINGAPKLADIGLVTHIGSQATHVGTDGYIPPEGPGSPSGDIYSLGRLLYEISMGKSQDQFPELPTRLRDLPDAIDLMRLNTIVLKACEKQPTKRFRSAEEFGTALEVLCRQLPSRSQCAPATPGDHALAGFKVLILCPSTIPGDASLVQAVAERFRTEGIAAFVDEQVVPSVAWARAIEATIRGATAVIPIFSPASVHNSMLAYGLEIAQQAAHRPNRLPCLLPICHGWTGPLPHYFSSSARPISVSSTESGTDLNKAADDLLTAFRASLPARPVH